MKQPRHPVTFKTADLILVGGLLALVAGLFLLLYRAPTGDTVEVQVDGKTIASLSLATDTTFAIDAGNGGHNTLVIENGKASVREATCPDGVCVRHRAIDRAGQSIICLPNKVVVRVVGEPTVDAEVGG